MRAATVRRLRLEIRAEKLQKGHPVPTVVCPLSLVGPLQPRLRVHNLTPFPNYEIEHASPNGVFIPRQADHISTLQYLIPSDIDITQISVGGDVGAMVHKDHIPVPLKRLDGVDIPIAHHPHRRGGQSGDVNSEVCCTRIKYRMDSLPELQCDDATLYRPGELPFSFPEPFTEEAQLIITYSSYIFFRNRRSPSGCSYPAQSLLFGNESLHLILQILPLLFLLSFLILKVGDIPSEVIDQAFLLISLLFQRFGFVPDRHKHLFVPASGLAKIIPGTVVLLLHGVDGLHLRLQKIIELLQIVGADQKLIERA